MTKQTYINTNPNFPIPELSYRTYDGEAWSEWKDLGSVKQFKDLGIVPLSFLNNIDLRWVSMYIAVKEDYAPGMLYVHYPDSNAIGCEQDRFYKGQIYRRYYNKRTGEWTEWETTSVYEEAMSIGYTGTKKTFYESLSLIDNLSFLKRVSAYDNIDTATTGGIYRVYDSDSITNENHVRYLFQ